MTPTADEAPLGDLGTWGAPGAPQAPRRSGNPGEAVAPLDQAISLHALSARRLADAAADANALLYYAMASGRDVGADVRDPILRVRSAVAAGEPVTAAGEGEFLAAYARLAVLVRPVTAATLRATSRVPPRHWLARALRLSPVSEARQAASAFGGLALLLLVAIGASEWTRTFITATLAAQSEHAKVREDLRAARLALKTVGEQIRTLDAEGVAATAARAAVREGLLRQRDDLDARVRALEDREGDLLRRIKAGYETLDRIIPVVDWSELRNVIVPVGTILGGFLLPVLYGGLGTCAYVLRSIYAQMVERSFDGRRTGDYVVRIFLGTLSGIALQWLLVREGGTVPGGVTPAVLAFLGGYSVELLFAAIDRLLAAVTGAIRGSPPPAASTRAEPARASSEVKQPETTGRP